MTKNLSEIRLNRAVAEARKRKIARVGIFLAVAIGLAVGTQLALADPTMFTLLMMLVWPILFSAIWLIMVSVIDRRSQKDRWLIEEQETKMRLEETAKRIAEAKERGEI
ncbi:MAG: hypothetical protein HKN27_07970 [Silicimonas sp.]|nr:hypothetical protein [Silicimonas sp.]